MKTNMELRDVSKEEEQQRITTVARTILRSKDTPLLSRLAEVVPYHKNAY